VCSCIFERERGADRVSLHVEWGAVAIVTVPCEHPTSVGSAWVEKESVAAWKDSSSQHCGSLCFCVEE